jgi:hypothetical protein
MSVLAEEIEESGTDLRKAGHRIDPVRNRCAVLGIEAAPVHPQMRLESALEHAQNPLRVSPCE